MNCLWSSWSPKRRNRVFRKKPGFSYVLIWNGTYCSLLALLLMVEEEYTEVGYVEFII